MLPLMLLLLFSLTFLTLSLKHTGASVLYTVYIYIMTLVQYRDYLFSKTMYSFIPAESVTVMTVNVMPHYPSILMLINALTQHFLQQCYKCNKCAIVSFLCSFSTSRQTLMWIPDSFFSRYCWLYFDSLQKQMMHTIGRDCVRVLFPAPLYILT